MNAPISFRSPYIRSTDKDLTNRLSSDKASAYKQGLKRVNSLKSFDLNSLKNIEKISNQ